MKRRAPELEDFGDFREEFEDGDELASVCGTLATLYPPQAGQYPKQNGYIVDEDDNKLFITFAVEDMFLEPGDWEGKYITVESKEGTGRNKGHFTGVKVKDPNGKGTQIWVTGTATVYDEDGDEVKTGGVEIPEGRGKRSGGKSNGSSRSRAKTSSRSDDSPEIKVDVFQLTENICNVNALAFSNYISMGLPKEVAAQLASSTAFSVAQWWFGGRAPEGIDEVGEELASRMKSKTSRKQSRKRRPEKEEQEEEYYDQDEDEFSGE
jgi:hypothetical protein